MWTARTVPTSSTAASASAPATSIAGTSAASRNRTCAMEPSTALGDRTKGIAVSFLFINLASFLKQILFDGIESSISKTIRDGRKIREERRINRAVNLIDSLFRIFVLYFPC